MRFIHRSGSTKEVATGAVEGDSAKGLERLFGIKKRNGDEGFDLLASIDGDDDARNDKSSFAPNLFRRQAKNKEPSAVATSKPTTKTTTSTTTTAASPLATLFQFKGNDVEARESSPPNNTKRKNKEKDTKDTNSGSAHPTMFQFKSREGTKEKSCTSPKSTSPAAATGAAGATSSAVPALFHLSPAAKDERREDSPKANRRRSTKKDDERNKSNTTSVVAPSLLFPFSSGSAAGAAAESPKATAVATRPILRRRQSKDKDEIEQAAAAAAAASATRSLPTLFQFNNSNSDNTTAFDTTISTVNDKKSSKTVAIAATAATVAGTAAVIPALFSRKSFDRDTTVTAAAATASSATHADDVKNASTSSSRNPVIMAKLFPKQERKQIKVAYNHFSADAAHVVQVEQDETPPKLVAPTHVLIKVQASTVTLNDCLLRRGFDFNVLSPLSLPLTPGYDVVGNVVEVGPRVALDSIALGDRVAAIVRTGGNARYLSVPYTSLVKVPSHLDSAEVAALVSIYTTAYQALRKVSGGSPMFSLEGKKVLILGGMDGVGQALIQMCKKARATIYATAPQVRHIYLKNVLGVNPLSETDWLPAVEGQLDYVFDGIREDGTEKSFKALKREGELVYYGHASMLKEREIGLLGAPFSARMSHLYTKMSFRVHTVDIWENFEQDPSVYKQDLKTLTQLLKWNKLKPHIAKRVSLAEVGAAQTKLENGDIRGTIVCFPWRPIRSGMITEGEDEA